MRRRLFVLLAFLNIGILGSMVNHQWSATNAATIGQWNAYMAYHDVTEIEEVGNTIFVLASNNLYSYNRNDQSIHTYSKANALSDSEIAHIKYCPGAKQLVIAYKNENIDIMDLNGNVTNISDYYNASLTGDKNIHSIDIHGIYAYLSTGFGIVKLNIRKAEISDTYHLGIEVDYSYVENGRLYAASKTNGLYAGNLSDNLLDQNNWSRVGEYTARSQQLNPELLSLINTLKPGGPKYNYFGFMKFINGKLYTCGGANGRKATIQVLGNNEEWDVYQDDGISEKTGLTYEDFYCIDIDPTDNTHLFAGGRNGLYEFKNGQFLQHYNDQNSLIESFDLQNKEYELITGIQFDKNGNLWMLNSLATSQGIIEYTNTGEWVSHPTPVLMVYNKNASLPNRALPMLSKMMTDSRGLTWFVNNNWVTPSLYCYQYQNEKDAINAYTTFTNEDGVKVSVWYARCVTEDKSGNIWIGTNVGPLMLEPSQITSENPVFTQVKVPRNDGTNYADYLLSGVDITCITIDGGGRKWFGTNGNGVYLISEDNYTQIQHFLTNNSLLLSNNIESIAINDQTGEVFFGTDKGLCSYMSDATATNDEMNKDNVWAYPNPVRPDYTGLITVTGLSYNADVKIVTSNGVLVAQGKSNGGTFTWDGCDQNGRRVASGIYMVETATSTGEKGTVCKIAVVN